MQNEKQENIELRSEEVQEVLGAPPKWIIRWGITIILSVFILLIVGSYFYKYPDIIIARVVILSENPPVQIVAKANGKLDEIFVENNQRVEKNEILGIIENTVDYYDAYRLLRKLDSLNNWFYDPQKIKGIYFKKDYNLGEYQTYYSSFVSQLINYQTFLSYNPFKQKILSLKRQVKDYRVYFDKYSQQTEVLKQDYMLSRNQFERDSMLFIQQIMAQAEYEKSKAALLKQQYKYQSAITNLADTKITMNNLEQQVQEQMIFNIETKNKLLAILKEKYEILINQLVDWQQTFVLKTPIEGQITFTKFWSANQYVASSEVVFTVVPQQEQKIIGRAVVPVAGAGKIKIGQQVNIKLDNFPHMEYGMLTGKIINISKVPVVGEKGSFYTVDISLVNELITNYNRELPFNQEMQGQAEIITNDRRLIVRLIEPLFSLVKERM